MMNSLDFTKLIREMVQDELGKHDRFKIATIASVSGTKPTLQFAGESNASVKEYSFLNGYTPTIGDRVLLARVSGTYVILDKLIS